MQQTMNCHLKLPEYFDYINAEDFNENMETLDEVLLTTKDELQYKTHVGNIILYAGFNDPDGWLICNGRILQTNLNDINDKYKSLYSMIVKNPLSSGIVDFQIPDLRGRIPFGASDGNIGEVGGVEKVKLSINEIPNHFHYYDKPNSGSVNFGGIGYITLIGFNPDSTTGSTGGDNSHNNMPPFGTINYIIKY